MSYDIFYDKQFIKAEKNGQEVFIPMIYGGSSNCFDAGTKGRDGRRSRDWDISTINLKGAYYGTQETILNNILAYRESLIERNKDKEDLNDNYRDKNFGWFSALSIGSKGTWNTTFNDYKNFYMTGCKKAMTVEELNNNGISVNVYTGSYSWDKEKFEKENKEGFDTYVKTSSELISLIDEKVEYYKDSSIYFYIKINANEDKMKRMRRELKQNSPHQTREKSLKEFDHYFALKSLDFETKYFTKKTTTRVFLNATTHPAYIKTFTSEKKAISFVEKLNQRSSYTFEVVKIEEKIKKLV